MKSKPALQFSQVSFAYEAHAPTILRDISFEIAPGSFTVIVGPSGGGKSTLLRLAIGLDMPKKGTIQNALRTRMVFQSGALLPWRTALENVAFGITDSSLTKHARRHKALEELAQLGIKEFAGMYPRDLSGGQRQRVGIARALATRPELLLLDEPFSALDVETTEKLSSELLAILASRGITMLMVSHSIEDAVLLADTILVVKDGTISAHVAVPLERPRARLDPDVERLVHRVKALIPSAAP